MGSGYTLPKCKGSPVVEGNQTLFWTDCYGIYKFENGGRYEGEFQRGRLHGKGLLVFQSGGRYNGEFKNNQFDGKGNYTSVNNNKYVGYFMKNRFHGKGSETWANGDKYSGIFQNGKAHGKGTYTWQNGNKYIGEYEKGKFHGKGTLIIENHRYVGNWNHNILMGRIGLKFHEKMKLYEPKNKNFHDWALGRLLFEGLEVPIDRERGLKWFRTAAEAGYEKAIDTLKQVRLELETKAISGCMFVNVKKITGPESKGIVLEHCRGLIQNFPLEKLIKRDYVVN